MDQERAAAEGRLTGVDLSAGAAIAVCMAAICFALSKGNSLLVTFVPGVVFAYGALILMWHNGRPLPAAQRFLPLYFVALSLQFLHFAEEFTTGFAEKFPVLYGGSAYSHTMFVQINMVSYALFVLSALAVFVLRVRRLAMPAIFFVLYGVMGNAIAHPYWAVLRRGYFPGLFTALLFWALGPWLVYILLGSKKQTAILIGLYVAVLVTTLSIGPVIPVMYVGGR
jgi:hypothetical protein